MAQAYPRADQFSGTANHVAYQLRVRPALRSFLSLILVIVGMTVAIYGFEFVTTYMTESFWRGAVKSPSASPLRWAMIVPIILVLEVTRRYYNDLYVVESDRVFHYAGRLSARYVVPTIRYSDIRAIQVNQGIIERILNIGDVHISTAAQDRAELSLSGVHSPRKLGLLIDDLRARHSRSAIESEDSPPLENDTTPDHHPQRLFDAAQVSTLRISDTR